jgi:hypothetical protein
MLRGRQLYCRNKTEETEMISKRSHCTYGKVSLFILCLFLLLLFDGLINSVWNKDHVESWQHRLPLRGRCLHGTTQMQTVSAGILTHDTRLEGAETVFASDHAVTVTGKKVVLRQTFP